MVLLGRPVLHGLAVDGQAGVEKVLNTLKKELKLNMALAGTLHVARNSAGGLGRHCGASSPAAAAATGITDPDTSLCLQGGQRWRTSRATWCWGLRSICRACDTAATVHFS